MLLYGYEKWPLVGSKTGGLHLGDNKSSKRVLEIWGSIEINCVTTIRMILILAIMPSSSAVDSALKGRFEQVNFLYFFPCGTTEQFEFSKKDEVFAVFSVIKRDAFMK